MCGRYLHFRLPYILLEAAAFQRLSLKVHEEKAISVQCRVLQPNQEAFPPGNVVNIRTSLSFNCIIIKNPFHVNGVALSLALKVRFFGTRKWPIRQGITRRRDDFISKGP